MSSPAQRRLAALMKQKQDQSNEQYKPLTSLPRAYLFEVKKFSYKQSNYPDPKNPNGPKPYNLIVHFSYADTNMYSYLPKEFSSTDESNIKETANIFNEDIKDKVVVNFAYYGVLDGQAKAKIHFNDEEIDQKLAEDVQRWEENNSDKMTGSPTKRPRMESPMKVDFSVGSPTKRSRMETPKKLDFSEIID